MSTLLMHIHGSRLYNWTFFRPHLYIYDDHIVYKRRHWLSHDEFSVNYKHISQTNLIRILIMYAHVEIVTTGQRNIHVHWVIKGPARQAKNIIDQKVLMAHKEERGILKRAPSLKIKDFELSLQRLKELLNTGKITKGEFKKKRKDLLKKHY